jgi:hypothetical protein
MSSQYSMLAYLFVPVIMRILIWIFNRRSRPFRSGQ